MEEVSSEKPSSLSVTQLEPSTFQPREAFDREELEALVESIRELGVIEPIAVRPCESEKYEIIAGERRWRAAQLAGLEQIPVIVHDVDDKTAAIITLIENLQRQNLNPIEEAKGIKQLIDKFGLNRQQAKKALGKSDTTMSRVLRLLELAEEVQQLVRQGKLSAGHAKVLIGLSPTDQIFLAKNTLAKDWSVRELERRKAQKLQTKTKSKTVFHPEWNEALLRLQKQLKQSGGSVRIKQKTTDGKIPQGVLEVPFERIEDCYALLKQLGVELDG
jgi:ParB family chromosome partitioning protein